LHCAGSMCIILFPLTHSDSKAWVSISKSKITVLVISSSKTFSKHITTIIVQPAPIQCLAPLAANNLQSGLSSANSVASSTLRCYDRLSFIVASQGHSAGLFQSLWGTVVKIQHAVVCYYNVVVKVIHACDCAMLFCADCINQSKHRLYFYWREFTELCSRSWPASVTNVTVAAV